MNHLSKLLSVTVTVLSLVSCAVTPSASVLQRPPPKTPKLRPDDAASAAYYRLLRRVPAEQAKAAGSSPLTVPMDAYPRAQAQASKLLSYSTRTSKFLSGTEQSKAAVPGWEFLGPKNVSGRMRAMAFDPRDSNRMLVAGVSGGIWESLDGAESWNALSLNTANINVGALVIDPQQPDTIYAGTGELYRNSERPYSSMWGLGILRSTDGGKSFQVLLDTLNENFRYVSDLAISQHNHRRIYAATNTGVWRSDDGGANFVQLLRPADGSQALRYEGCSDLQMLPDDQRDVLLVSCSSRSSNDRYNLPGTVIPPACGNPCPAAIFRNDDAAADQGAGFVEVLSEPGMGRTSIDYARSSPDVVYALSASILRGPDRTGDGLGDYENGLHAVWRSDDGGRTWNAQLRNTSSDLLSTYMLSYADSFESPRCGFGPARPYSAGWYNQAIAVDPLNPDVVWVAGMEHYRSENGGRNFGKASYWFNFQVEPTSVHPDQHLLRFHPDYDGINNRTLYSLNDAGIAITSNANAATSRGLTAACGPQSSNQITWRDMSYGLGTAQFYTGAATASGEIYMGGLQDNGTVSSSGGDVDWDSIYGGDGAGVAFDPRDDNVRYYSAQGITMVRSEDGGRTSTRVTNGLLDRTIFIMPYVMDKQFPNRLFAGGTRIWRTDNRGDTWRAISTPLGGDFTDRISALAIAPNSNRMLVGNQHAIYYRPFALSANTTTQWLSISPRAGWVSSLNFDPVDSQIAYATYSSFGGAHVWKTSNGGESWEAIDGSAGARLPDVPVHTLAIDPNNRQRLYIGTDIGIFVSLDGGAHWAQENSGFAAVIVEKLEIAPGENGAPAQLFAFTYGRGAWRVPLADLTGTADYRIGVDTTGAFYNADQSGHGWFIEAIENNGVIEVLAAWYTYLDGEPRWLFGSGSTDGNRATITLNAGSNTGFPPLFDANAVRVEPWGEVEFDFDNADQFQASWTPNATNQAAGYSAGTLPFTRLSAPAPADTVSPSSGISACHSGAWYNLAQPGHGFTVEVLGSGESRQLLAAWYVHLNGQSYWLIGQGPVTGDTATLDMLSLSGGQFPPLFDADAVVREAWGTLNFTAIDADNAHIAWSSQRPGFSSGELDLSRLTSTLGRPCVD